MTNGWKTTAIILLVLLILSWAGFILVVILGIGILDNETRCWIEVGNLGYETFYYEVPTKICYGFVDGEVVYQEFIG